jgi:hypothetical protein
LKTLSGGWNSPNPEPELAPDLPDTGNFIAVAGIEPYRDFNEKVQQLMPENEQLDTCVIHSASNNPYTGLSDQRNCYHFGYPALMITDTAIIRNSHNYHQTNDTIDTLDFDRMSEAVNSIYLAVVGQLRIRIVAFFLACLKNDQTSLVLTNFGQINKWRVIHILKYIRLNPGILRYQSDSMMIRSG